MIRRLLLSLVLMCTMLAVPVANASAAGLLDQACGAPGSANNPGQSAGCTAGQTDPNSILAKAAKIVSVLAGVAAVILIVVSGIFFALAEGDPAKINGARNTLIGAIVGVFIVASAQALLRFVLIRVK